MPPEAKLNLNSRSQMLEHALYLAGGCFLVANVVLSIMGIPLPSITRYLSVALSLLLIVAAQALRRRLISYTLSGYILLLFVAITVFAMSLVSSGFRGPVNSILLLLPAYGALFLGIRGCMFFSMVSAVFLLVAYQLDMSGYLNYEVYSEEQALLSKLIVFMFAIIGVAAVSSTHEFSRRRAESAMTELNSELESAHKEAERSLLVKSQFLANISHEVRTPLNGILGMVTLLRERVDDPAVVRQLKTIEFSGESLLAMLNDVLDASKLESGKLELESAPYHLVEQVNSVAEVFSVLAAQQGIALKLSIAEGIPEVIEGDALRLSQVLFNLVSNAIKFSNDNDVELRLSAEHLTDDHYRIRVDVIDSGIGISKGNIEKLFQPFSQANTSTTREFGGSGLGLAICKGIIEQMGGEIWVESEEMKGSTFSISFPAQTRDPAGYSESKELVAPGLAGNGELHPLRILVAEDNEVNRQVVEAFLGRLGYHADYVENGKRAVEFACSKSYDLILMDCQMPVLDGFDATREIIHHLGTQRPHIVALTAISQAVELERCLEAGMDEVITKPLRMVRLEELLTDVSIGMRRGLEQDTELKSG